MKKCDFLIVGSGIAGLSIALKLSKVGKVVILTKKQLLDTSTSLAQGGIACVMKQSDSTELHASDTLIAGAGLCDKKVVFQILKQSKNAINDLINAGVKFDKKSGSNEFDLTKEGGHTERRILHSKDITGKEINEKLLNTVKKQTNITFLENYYVIDLITKTKIGLPAEDRCIGLYALNKKSGKVATFCANYTILATGGCGRVYLYTSNPIVATGDGVAIAWRAGAAIKNMEFIQFHPTCLYHHKARSFLISESIRGEGGILKNSEGKTFMKKYHKLGSLAPRDIVARAIDNELKKSGASCVYIDIRHKSKEFLSNRFPNIFTKCLSLGIDISKELIPVVPAAHYQCGGIRTKINGKTDIKGLYAIGECACTGLHGANRLASNSLLEAAVMAEQAYKDIKKNLLIHKAKKYKIPEWQSGYAVNIDERVVIYHNWDEIRRLMWDYVSIVRTDKRLIRAANRIRNLKREIREFYWRFKVNEDILELRNLADCAALIIECASRRHESRGLHFTLNHPKTSKEVKETISFRY